jgi:hypothetical protein
MRAFRMIFETRDLDEGRVECMAISCRMAKTRNRQMIIHLEKKGLVERGEWSAVIKLLRGLP